MKACTLTGIAFCALERKAWVQKPNDHWKSVADINAAVAAIPEEPHNIFLAIGKQHLAEFSAKPQHYYLTRLVDRPQEPLSIPTYTSVISKGPFTYSEDKALIQSHAINLIIAKNSGGKGAQAKLDVARDLRIPVIMIDRPPIPDRLHFENVTDVIHWLDHGTHFP